MFVQTFVIKYVYPRIGCELVQNSFRHFVEVSSRRYVEQTPFQLNEPNNRRRLSLTVLQYNYFLTLPLQTARIILILKNRLKKSLANTPSTFMPCTPFQVNTGSAQYFYALNTQSAILLQNLKNFESLLNFSILVSSSLPICQGFS